MKPYLQWKLYDHDTFLPRYLQILISLFPLRRIEKEEKQETASPLYQENNIHGTEEKFFPQNFRHIYPSILTNKIDREKECLDRLLASRYRKEHRKLH